MLWERTGAGRACARRGRGATRASPRSSPAARACTSTLPSAVASTGPASTGSPARSAVRWQSSSLSEPPPTMWIVRTSTPPMRPASRAVSAKAWASDSTMLRAYSARVRGSRDAVLGAPLVDARRHVAGREEARVVHVEDGDGCRDLLRRVEQRRQVDRVTLALPRPDGFAQHPEAHDVVQQPHAAVDAALVREVGRERLGGEDEVVDLDPDEAPGSARDVGRGIRLHRHRDDRRGGVVRADRGDGRARSRADRGGDVGQQGAEALAGGDERGEDAAGDAEGPDELVVPGAVQHSEEAGGRGVGLLRAGLAGQPVADQVGDEQGGVGELEDVAGLGGELVERVEREELQPVALEELGVRHPVVDALRRRAPCGCRGSGTGRRAGDRRAAARSRRPTSRRRCSRCRVRRGTPRGAPSRRRRRATGRPSAGRR